jgi:hypothetical protein
MPMKDASLPITLIVVGAAWLLWDYRLFPDLDWIIAGGLVAGGIAIFARHPGIPETSRRGSKTG